MDRPGISLEEWYPLVEGVVPTPKTIIIRSKKDLAALAYGQDASTKDVEVAYDEVCKAVRQAGDEIGWPCFLRTGLTSGKHDWVNTCYVPSREDVQQHVYNIVEYSQLVDLFGLATDVWVVRELLRTQAPFTAFEGFPVTRERRYFIEDGEVVGWHPYWPPETIQQPSIRGWRRLLAELNETVPGERVQLGVMSEKVAAVVPGAWSVDWLLTDEGWFLTDMAHAESSYIWEEYPSAPKFARHA